MQDGLTRVLIADDEPGICSLIQVELTSCGFHCRAVSPSDDPKKLLGEGRFDILIADIHMPGVSGLDLLAHARQHSPACKVILITGVSNREYLAQALMLGAYDYIQKPFAPGELVKTVSQAAEDKHHTPKLPVRAAEAMAMSEQVKVAALDSVRALVRAVEAKDPYTRRHSEQVAHYAVSLATATGMSEGEIETIRIAAILHDIGKIGVPDRILIKPGKLTDEEFEQIRRHPAMGADILSNITLFSHESRLVRHHHEKWDGSGYPDGLVGEECPLGARIIMVADCMDAMLMERTYKAGYGVAKTLQELIRCAGTQFDPKLASVAVQWCRMNPDKLVLPEATPGPMQTVEYSA